MTTYRATFHKRDEKTKKLTKLGSVTVNNFGIQFSTSHGFDKQQQLFSLVAKAFLQAPKGCGSADKVTFEQLSGVSNG